MSEIHYKDFKEYLANLKQNRPPNAYLIYGEGFLVDIVLTGMLDVLILESDREFNYEKFDLDDSSVEAVLESMNTYSFFSERKIVSVDITRMFSKDSRRKNEDAQTDAETDRAKDETALIQEAIESGFPDNHLLLLTAEKVDKRRALYKTLKASGMIIDCSIPLGNRMADRKAQEAVLFECMNTIVSENGKSMDKKAFASLLDSTGFDPAIFAKNLEKLVSYAGERDAITADDVAALIARTKKDPIFELTGAISEKNVGKALSLIGSLLEDGLYPLQILSGITNHIRKLLLVKDFSETTFGNKKATQSGISYDYFKNNIVPAMISWDDQLKQYIEKQENTMADDGDVSGTPGANQPKTDLILVKNPNNPYPIFQTFLAADRFSKNELLNAMKQLGEADILLKTTGRDAKMVMDRLVFKICDMPC